MFTCETCERESILPLCGTCGFRRSDVLHRHRLVPGEEYEIRNIDLICGEGSTNHDRTFNIPMAHILVNSTDETEQVFFVHVTRLPDQKRFRINATKPGPWEQYPVAESCLGSTAPAPRGFRRVR